MLVTLLGMLMLVRLLQPENAAYPMLVTLSGMVMLVRLLQPSNAKSPMVSTLRPSIIAGISIAPVASVG